MYQTSSQQTFSQKFSLQTFTLLNPRSSRVLVSSTSSLKNFTTDRTRTSRETKYFSEDERTCTVHAFVFSTLMSIANDWLQRNGCYAVLTCECIERLIDKHGCVESDTTIRMKGIFTASSFVRGVR